MKCRSSAFLMTVIWTEFWDVSKKALKNLKSVIPAHKRSQQYRNEHNINLECSLHFRGTLQVAMVTECLHCEEKRPTWTRWYNIIVYRKGPSKISAILVIIKPFPSFFFLLFQNESWYTTFHKERVTFAGQWTCKKNSFPYERLHTKTHFETDLTGFFGLPDYNNNNNNNTLFKCQGLLALSH